MTSFAQRIKEYLKCSDEHATDVAVHIEQLCAQHKKSSDDLSRAKFETIVALSDMLVRSEKELNSALGKANTTLMKYGNIDLSDTQSRHY